MITENKDNKVLAMQPLDFDLARALFNAGKQMSLCVHVYTPDGVYISNINPDEITFLKGRMEYTDLEDIDQLAGQPVLKVLFESGDFESLKPIPARIHALSDQCEPE